jgi:hypothetical protein
MTTFFLAHAGADKDRALDLHRRLHPGIPTFLDAVDLLPGDDWPRVLARAQQQARATIALVSDRSDAAYYLSEEIHAAIAYQRADADRHRLIPVYLDGYPTDATRVQYGLRVKHHLDARTLGLDGVVAELRRVAAALPKPTIWRGDGTRSGSLATTPAVDRVSLFDALCALLDAAFEELLFRVSAPLHLLPSRVAPRAERAISLIQWAESQTAGLAPIVAEARRHAPGRL